MKASANTPGNRAQTSGHSAPVPLTSGDGIDIGLLEESLSKTVWERMLANDDALRLADLLQDAVLTRVQNLSELTRRLVEAQVEFILIGAFAITIGSPCDN